jgi:hypothetical protein
MKAFEICAAVVLAAAGARSLVHWLRLPFAGEDPIDHLLFALFVLGRVGFWWSLAGLFAIYASLTGSLVGVAFTDEIRTRFWWYPVIVAAFGAMQFAAGYFLSRRREPAG